jgi:hypothetical protein
MKTVTNPLAVGGRLACVSVALIFFLAGTISGQSVSGSLQQKTDSSPATKALSSPVQPVASIYREVKIGTDADEVKKLLGKPKIDDKDGFFYEMDSEIVQIRLDDNAKVRVISVTYPSNSPNTPKYVEIFGSEKMEAKPDGSVYNLVRYPDAGYWIAYSKTAGAAPTVTVTMQKL